MESSKVNNSKFFELFAILLTIYVIKSVPLFVSMEIFSLFMWFFAFLFFIFFLPYFKRDLNLTGFLYCIAIILGFVFHKIRGLDVRLDDGFFNEAVVRIIPILIILHYKKNDNCPNKAIRLFALFFFVLECFIAINEKLTMTHLLDYKSDTQAMNADMSVSEDFRSFSLMAHPLWNANVVSIMLAFILCSDTIKLIPKILLVLLGMGAIWSFNSRAALGIWLLLIFYRLFLYDRSYKWWLTCFIILLITLPSMLLYIQKTGALGRLTFDFSDDSTLTRIMAIEMFLTYPWSFNDMIMGGVYLEQPVISSSLAVRNSIGIENGFLLDLGYWGFFLGIFKIWGEIALSYYALKNFHLKDKIIIMIAFWGVASMNNNSFMTFLMPFFMCSYMAFDNKKLSIQENEYSKK